jgi:hypothetical protein
MKSQGKMSRPQAKPSTIPLIQAQKIAPAPLLAQTQSLFQQPALMFAVKGFDQASVFWFSPGAVLLNGVHGRGQSCKTTVEQALMRGLVTA